MQRVKEILSSDAAGEATDRVRLDLEGRRRRRHVVATEAGRRLLIDLARPPALKHGDGLRLEDGRIVLVEAAAERLIEVTAPDLVRIAWHLGNRHLPVEILGDRLRLREDHVIAAMLAQLGAEVRPIEAPFEPEGGAYGPGSTHGHEHGHGHGHG